MEVTAPWPGTVQEVHVAIGDTVSPEQPVVTLEAMKMLSPVPSPGAGTVSAVHVSTGEYVEAGKALITLD